MEITLINLQQKIPISKHKVLKAAKAAFHKLEKRGRTLFSISSFKKKGVRPLFSIVFVSPQRMRAINKKYLNHDYVTDVLTFGLGDNAGEIIICPQVACSNAKVHQTSTEREIILYVIHGILHLAGFDDHKPKDILLMRRMENELL